MRRPMMCFVMLAILAIVGPAAAAWNPNPYTGGAPVCTASSSQYGQAMIEDGSGGFFVAWIDQRSGTEVYVQHLDRNADPIWTPDGVPATVGADPSEVSLAPDGAGGVVVVWSDRRAATGNVIYAQRVNAAGTPQWSAAGNALTGSGTTLLRPQRYDLHAVEDGSGGACLTWEQYTIDRFGAESNPVVMVQRVDGTGVRQWGTNGIGVSTGTLTQGGPELIGDAAGGMIVAWHETRSGTNIYAQHYNSAGSPLWTANGILASGTYAGTGVSLAADGAGGALLTWASSGNIYARRMNGAGTFLWNGAFGFPITVCTATGTQSEPVVTPDGSGGGLIAWTDERNPSTAKDIYMQRFSAAGGPAWAADGVAVCTAPKNQNTPRLVPDGAQGALAVWSDLRGSDADLYGSHVSSAGIQWLVGGTAIAGAGWGPGPHGVVRDDRGGAIVGWSDIRSGFADIYAQRLDPYDYLGDPAPRILAVEDVPNDQGGRVKVSWTASTADVDPIPAASDYRLWRQTAPDTWSLVATQPAAALASYSMVASTAADSGAAPAPEVFRIEARRFGHSLSFFWYSEPDSGYSIDNYPPSPVVQLAGSYLEGTTILSWAPGGDPDLYGYRVYRGETHGFLRDAAHLVGTPVTAGFVDPAGSAYAYQVTAVDRSGNESAAASWAPEGVPLGRLRAWAGLPSPNPARAGASLGFRLSARSRVSLGVWDVQGRRVRVIETEELEPGDHRLDWNLRDDSGFRVAPGVYFVRLTMNDGILGTRSLVVLE